MRLRLPIAASAVVLSLLAFLKSTEITAQDRAATTSGKAAVGAVLTRWGEPDLQGIWTVEYDTPLQRPAKYADQEFFSEAQRAELDRARGVLLGTNKREARGTEADVSGAY